MTIIVYKMDASPPARTVLITAQILGLDVETKEVNVLAKEQFGPEYLDKNPTHTIPLLEDGAFILSDSHAIIIYLVSKYGEEKEATLYPTDIESRAIIHQRLFFDASILFPRFLALARDVAYDGAVSLDKDKIASVEEAYGFLEKYLERSTFVAGENITIADIACVTTVSTLNTMFPLDDQYPKIRAWLEHLSSKEWYQKHNQPGVSDFGSLFMSLLQKNAENSVSIDII